MSSKKQKLLTYDEAVAMLPAANAIRVLYGGISLAVMLRSDVLKLLENGRPELSGDVAVERGFGICAYENIYKASDGELHGSPVFIEAEEVV